MISISTVSPFRIALPYVRRAAAIPVFGNYVCDVTFSCGDVTGARSMPAADENACESRREEEGEGESDRRGLLSNRINHMINI